MMVEYEWFSSMISTIGAVLARAASGSPTSTNPSIATNVTMTRTDHTATSPPGSAPIRSPIVCVGGEAGQDGARAPVSAWHAGRTTPSATGTRPVVVVYEGRAGRQLGRLASRK